MYALGNSALGAVDMKKEKMYFASDRFFFLNSKQPKHCGTTNSSTREICQKNTTLKAMNTLLQLQLFIRQQKCSGLQNRLWLFMQKCHSYPLSLLHLGPGLSVWQLVLLLEFSSMWETVSNNLFGEVLKMVDRLGFLNWFCNFRDQGGFKQTFQNAMKDLSLSLGSV